MCIRHGERQIISQQCLSVQCVQKQTIAIFVRCLEQTRSSAVTSAAADAPISTPNRQTIVNKHRPTAASFLKQTHFGAITRRKAGRDSENDPPCLLARAQTIFAAAPTRNKNGGLHIKHLCNRPEIREPYVINDSQLWMRSVWVYISNPARHSLVTVWHLITEKHGDRNNGISAR